VAEQGDELRAPGGTVFAVDADIGTGGGDEGAEVDETLLCKGNKKTLLKMTSSAVVMHDEKNQNLIDIHYNYH
jgi:hypothetical protein